MSARCPSTSSNKDVNGVLDGRVRGSLAAAGLLQGDEILYGAIVAELDGAMERRITIVVAGLGVASMLDEPVGGLLVSVDRCPMERGGSLMIESIHISAVLP